MKFDPNYRRERCSLQGFGMVSMCWGFPGFFSLYVGWDEWILVGWLGNGVKKDFFCQICEK